MYSEKEVILAVPKEFAEELQFAWAQKMYLQIRQGSKQQWNAIILGSRLNKYNGVRRWSRTPKTSEKKQKTKGSQLLRSIYWNELIKIKPQSINLP